MSNTLPSADGSGYGAQAPHPPPQQPYMGQGGPQPQGGVPPQGGQFQGQPAQTMPPQQNMGHGPPQHQPGPLEAELISFD